MDDIDGKVEPPEKVIDKLIERWWEDHFPGSAVARDTIAWNIAYAAKETLKRQLVQAQSLSRAKAGDEDLQRSI